jgi:hypothetical protein
VNTSSPLSGQCALVTRNESEDGDYAALAPGPSPKGKGENCREATMTTKHAWPDGKRFAFTVFDDTDSATLESVQGVYDLLADCGLRTTKSVWVVAGDRGRGKKPGQTCADPDY